MTTFRFCPAPAAASPVFLPGRRLAAPSWVIPAPLEENCIFLSERVDEVGLLFFETANSLAYTEADIPSTLAGLPLSFHLHLPVDLPWPEPALPAEVCLRLLRKVSLLRDAAPEGMSPPRHCRAVLHPPAHDPADSCRAARALASFARAFHDDGGQTSLLLLENLRDNDLTGLAGVIAERDFGICLDTGHMLAYGQESLPRNDFFLERTAMLHLCAPGKDGQKGRHLPLTALDRAGEDLCGRLVCEAPRESVIMMELFDWNDIERSLPFVRSWLLPHV